MGQWAAARLCGYRRFRVSTFSACSFVALDGVSWVQSGSVEIAVGQNDRMLQYPRRHLLPPSGVAPLGSSVRPPFRRVLLDYAGSNSVPCRSMACMMIEMDPDRETAGAVF